MIKRRQVVLALVLAALTACAALAVRSHRDQVHTAPAPSAAAPAPAALPVAPFEETDWFALVPRDWEPGKTFGADIARLGDNDPRAIDALEKLRAAWADAPVEPAMDGARIKIGGFVIPLDLDNGAATEFCWCRTSAPASTRPLRPRTRSSTFLRASQCAICR
jgi:hypothetical protein